MGTAVWEFLNALVKYDGSKTAHSDVISALKHYGHTIKESEAWCTETQMAALFDCGAAGLVGGFASNAGRLKSNGEKLGLWRDGTSDILPGDIVIFGTDGKANHTEGCVGYQVDVSGNYNGGCGRRSYKGRHVLGRIRPKWAEKDMDNLQVVIEAANCILDVYGSGSNREKALAVFGSKNAKMIQEEVDRIKDSEEDTLFDLAVYVIAGHAGKEKYRAKRLGSYAEKVQGKIGEIYNMRGKTPEEAAQLVLDRRFGTRAVRVLLLKFCGYDPDEVQEAVNKLLSTPEKAPEESPENC